MSPAPAAPPAAADAAGVPVVERHLRRPFLIVASLFLAWALAASLNDVLIRHFQKALAITRGQSGFIQFAFYIGYFCAALPAGMMMRRFGYKAGILVGLALYCGGALLFWPAADARSYPLFLGGLYVIAFGLAFLETAANPYAAALGDPRTGPARLNLAQSFYGLGVVLGPLIGGLFIFSGVEHDAATLARMGPAAVDAYRVAEAQALVAPYLGVAGLAALLFLVVSLTRLPKLAALTDAPEGTLRSVLRERHVRCAVFAQFAYVGTQVAIWSYFIDYSKEMVPSLPERSAALLLSASLALVMIGRLSGTFLMTRLSAPALLGYYAVANIVLCALAAALGGWAGIAALWATSFFMSIMFPTIFALGVAGLGGAAKLASSLLIMSIIGGAVMPPAMGYLADQLGGLRPALILPIAGFAVVLWFARRGWRPLA